MKNRFKIQTCIYSLFILCALVLSAGAGDLTIKGDLNITSNLTGEGTVDVRTNRIINVAEPISSNDAATKAYVDENVISGTVGSNRIDWATMPAGLQDGDDDTTYTGGTGITIDGTTINNNLGTDIQSNEIDWVTMPSGLQDGDDDTTYSGGTGITVDGTTINNDLGTDISSNEINWATMPTGLQDGDDDTTYTGGTGITIDGTTINNDLGTDISSNEINWTTMPTGLQDGDDDTTYSAGTGMNLSDGAFNIDPAVVITNVINGGTSGTTGNISRTASGVTVTFPSLSDWASEPASQNVNLDGHWLSGDGSSKGVYLTTAGDVVLGTSTTGYFKVDAASGDMDARNNKITGLADATSDGDAATKKYVDDHNYPSKTAATVYLNTDQAVSSNVWTDVFFNTKEYDYGNNFSLGQTKFTCPSAGKYLITSMIRMKDIPVGTFILLRILRGASAEAESVTYASSGGWPSALPVTKVVSCNSGDDIKIQVYHNDGALKNIYGAKEFSYASFVKISD